MHREPVGPLPCSQLPTPAPASSCTYLCIGSWDALFKWHRFEIIPSPAPSSVQHDKQYSQQAPPAMLSITRQTSHPSEPLSRKTLQTDRKEGDKEGRAMIFFPAQNRARCWQTLSSREGIGSRLQRHSVVYFSFILYGPLYLIFMPSEVFVAHTFQCTYYKHQEATVGQLTWYFQRSKVEEEKKVGNVWAPLEWVDSIQHQQVLW